MKKYFIFSLLLLLTNPIFANKDDLVVKNNKIKLSESRSLSCDLLSSELINEIIEQIEAQKDTLEEINLWHNGDDQENLFPILQALEKCPKLRNVSVKNVSSSTYLGLYFLKLRKNGFQKDPFLFKADHLKLTISSSLIEQAVIEENLIKRLAKYLNCEPVYTSAYLLEDDKAAIMDEFFRKCCEENFYFLSKPEIHKFFEPPFPWAPGER